MSSTHFQHAPNPSSTSGKDDGSPGSKLWYETGNDYNRVFRARTVDEDEVNNYVDGNYDMYPLKNDVDEKKTLPRIYVFCFWVIAFSYMCAWTSFGSLVPYYKRHYSAFVYNLIYCAFYLPGLPICILQYKFDSYYDSKYGSQDTYLLRGVFFLTVSIIMVVSMIWIERDWLLILAFVILGICSWAMHGTASTLASIYPPSCIGALQTGFRSPEVFTLGTTLLLNIGSAPDSPSLRYFYTFTSIGVFSGLASWIVLTTNARAKRYFREVDSAYDKENRAKALASDKDSESILQSCSRSLKSFINGFRGVSLGIVPNADDIWKDDYVTHNTLTNSGSETKSILYNNALSLEISEDNYFGKGIRDEEGAFTENGRHSPYLGEQDLEKVPLLISKGTQSQSKERENVSAVLLTEKEEMMMATGGGVGYSLHSSSTDSGSSFIFEQSTQAVTYSPEKVRKKVMLLCYALALTMLPSIFQASFFGYVESPTGLNIGQYLYFTRLFSDLLGRPLASLPRPWFVKTDKQVLNLCVWRLFILFMPFFIYVFTPLLPQNDIFVCILVGLFSVVNGYFAVLIYEYASNTCVAMGRNAQIYGTTLLNLTFHASTFTSVIVSVTLTCFIIPKDG